MSVNSRQVKFKPGFFRIVMNSIWGVIFLFFGLLIFILSFGLLADKQWLMGIGALIIGPVLLYYAIASYFIGSFTSYFLYENGKFEFRNVKSRYTFHITDLANIKWTLRKRKLKNIIFILQNGAEISFDADIYSNNDRKTMVEFLKRIGSPTTAVGQTIPTGRSTPSSQSSGNFCGDCGADAGGLHFCQNCGAKVLS